ncbi:MAG: choice-of-anchor D domain-containing protein [Deltaproteobacteria bacterium]
MGGRAFRALAAGLVVAGAGCRARPQIAPSDDQVAVSGLDLGVIPLGLTARGSVSVAAMGASAVVVSAVKPPPDAPSGLSVDAPFPLSIAGGATAQIPVALAPTATGAIDIPLALELDPGGEQFVHVTAQVVKVNLSTARSLDFGPVSLRALSTLTLTVSNGADLAVAAPVSLAASGPFSLPGLPSSGRLLVPANGSSALAVTFSPSLLGPAQGALAIAPCPGCAAVTVALSGVGVGSVVSVSPASLAFGDLALGKAKTLAVTVANAGNLPLALPSVSISSGGPPFSVNPSGALVVPPQGTLALAVTFAPTLAGAAQGALAIQTADPNSPLVTVPLAGAGGSPSIAVLPPAIDFGGVPLGVQETQPLLVVNAGDPGAGVAPLTISNVSLTGPFTLTGPATATLPAGQSETLQVSFTPAASGLVTGSLTIASDDPLTPEVRVPLSGAGRVPLPCVWSAAPSEVDFGLVAPGQAVRLSVALQNAGADQCVVSNLALAPGSAPAFELLGGPFTPVVLQPGDRYDVGLRFAPTAAGTDVGQLAFGVSNPSAPTGQVPIFGVARAGCLTIAPTDLAFGSVGVSCPAHAQTVTLSNACQGPVTVASATIGAGTSADFALAPAALPATLAVGASMQLTVDYQPSPSDPNDDPDNAALLIDDGEGQPRTVGLSGIGVQSPDKTDTFTQQAASKVDVLMVIDNSGSFEAQQAAMRDNASTFLQAALASGVDFHLGVTTTGIEPATGSWSICPGGANGGEAGRLFPVDDSSPRLLSPQTPNLVADLANNVMVGTCHWDEQPFQAAVDALTPPLSTSAKAPGTPWPADGNLGFLRQDALLNILFIQDDDDESQLPVDHFVPLLKELKGVGNEWMITASAVTSVAGCNEPSDLGVRYAKLVGELGGQIYSVCTQDWGGLMGQLASQAFSLRLRFPLSGTPLDPSQLSVTVNGQAVPSAGGWSYDATTNEVIFAPGSAPPANSQIQVSYAVACS